MDKKDESILANKALSKVIYAIEDAIHFVEPVSREGADILKHTQYLVERVSWWVESKNEQ